MKLSSTAETVVLEAYEESCPAKKPNRPHQREARKCLVQILDLDNTKDNRKFQPLVLSSLKVFPGL